MLLLIRVAVCSAVLALGACNIAGPAALSNGRSTYNAVITATENEQVLAMIVANRYDEPFGMLMVSSVTASLRLGASVGANVGIGSDSSYEGNLVPFSAGATYEENPTISYVPHHGEQFAESMLEPIKLEHAVLLGRASTNEVEALAVVAQRLNGFTNPLYARRDVGPEFGRCIDILAQLRHGGMLDILMMPGDTFRVIIHNYAEVTEAVRELLSTLNIEATIGGSPIDLGLKREFGAPCQNCFDIETPSTREILRALGRGIELPDADVRAGIVRADDGRPTPLKIHSADARPDLAAVAIRHGDHWFYIDARDARSKQTFMLLRDLIAMRVDATAIGQQAPVLTVPVAR